MTKKNLTLVVTGHQLTADTIAQAIGATEKHKGYYLGNGYAVVWTNGTLINAFFQPNESFVLSTSMDPKHIYAHNFKFEMRDYDYLLGYKKSDVDKFHLAVIKALWSMSHTVVNAMTPDLNGELDFLNLYYFLAAPVNVRRAWLPVLTKPEIVKSVENGPKSPGKYAEWFETSIYNYLVDECSSDEEYVEEYLFVESSEEIVDLELDTLCEYASNNTRNGTVMIANQSIYTYSDKPTLYNLPQLLIAGACDLEFTHEKTVQTALNLYAKKLISYPMVQQNYIPTEVWRKMRYNREVLRFNPMWGKSVRGHQVSERHNFDENMNPYYGFGIVTTGLHPTDLTRDEERLYNLIVKRVLDAFTSNHTLGNRKDKERSRQRDIQREN